MKQYFTRFITAISLTVSVIISVYGCATSEEFVRPDTNFTKYKRVAVLPLVDYPAFPGSGVQVADIISMKLLSSKLTILDRIQTSQILNEQSIGMSGIIDNNTAPEVGKILGVQALLTGSINEYGTTTVDIQVVQGGKPAPMDISAAGITLKLIDCETGQIIWAGSARGTKVGNHVEAIAASKAVENLLKSFNKHFH